MTRSFSLAVLVLALSTSLLVAQDGASLNDEARFLAGLPVRGSALEVNAHTKSWMDHATGMDSAFNRQEERQLAKVRAWSQAMVPGANGGGTVYYMFSGPDFLYANAFFPQANTYILCGTEPIGNVPDLAKLTPEQLDIGLEGLRQSMKTILDFHYFITKDMRVDLQRTQINGTLPILFVFLARTGNAINEVAMVNSPAPGVKITFTGGAGHAQTLYYFKNDLSNGGRNGAFLKWCGGQGPGMSLLKAASYLMHTNEFSTIRSFLLQNSRVLVEDDSGITFHDLLAAHLDVHVYGTYEGPIELFAKNYQPDLEQAYKQSNPGPLGFGFGYHWQTDRGMLILAMRK
jgi:hypothetical protein